MLSVVQVYKFGALLVAHLFLLTLFTPITILLFWASMLLIYCYLKLRVKRAMQKGLISYLPQKLRAGLIERSLFDVLCDIWFMPITSNILRALTKPFYTSVRPDQAASLLDDLSPQIRKQFLTKGIVNIFPHNLKGVLVSQQQRQELNKREQLAIVGANEIQKSPSKQLQSKNSYKESTSDTLNNRRRGDKLRLAMNKEFDDEPSFSNGSQGEKKPEEQKLEEGNHKWDKLEIYHNIKERLPSGYSIAQLVKNNVGLFKNLLHLNSVLVTRVSAGKVVKFFLFFLLVLFLQMRLTSQNKKMVVSVIRIFISVATVLGLVGTGGLLIYKGYRVRSSTRSITHQR